MKAIFFVLILSSQAWGHQPREGKVTATLGPLAYSPNFDSQGQNYGTPSMGGFGYLFEGDIDKNGGVEAGLFYLNKFYYRTLNSGLYVERSRRINILLGYRHWFFNSLSAGLAFTSSFAMGEAEIIHNGLAANESLTTTAQSTTEYGFDISIQWEAFSYKSFSLLLDTRYFASVTSKPNENADYYGGLVGLKYVIQEKKAQIKRRNIKTGQTSKINYWRSKNGPAPKSKSSLSLDHAQNFGTTEPSSSDPAGN